MFDDTPEKKAIWKKIRAANERIEEIVDLMRPLDAEVQLLLNTSKELHEELRSIPPEHVRVSRNIHRNIEKMKLEKLARQILVKKS